MTTTAQRSVVTAGCLALVVVVVLLLGGTHAFSTTGTPTLQQQRSSSALFMAQQQRENEIRRKILQLKRQGRIANKNSDAEETTTLEKMRKENSASQDYSDKLKAKLGKKKLSLMGIPQDDDEYDEDDELYSDDVEDDAGTTASASTKTARLGSLPREQEPDEESTATPEASNKPSIIDPSLFESDDDDEPDMDEQDLIELVAQKLELQEAQATTPSSQSTITDTTPIQQTTSGVGGTWTKNETAATVETYQPKSGSWGAFPRPKDISKAYGGGRRVGVGFSEEQLATSTQSTRERLRQYREKVGIEVQSEKDHATEIQEAVNLAGYAMQRGMYSSAVSILEKVTPYCSTNSKVGGNVFLELAMAYEADGRTKEAVTVYTTLTNCRIEEIKFNAKRLLYGIEAMQFMRNEAKSAEFSRKKIRNTFIDTTGLANIAENFDDVYQTAYIDLDNGFYRRLTQSVVRSNREARQILLSATGHGQVEHVKIVQALRSLSRFFDTALQDEQKKAAPRSVAVMNGKPIVAPDVATVVAGMDEFVLTSADQMLELLNGEWRLQLMADRQGDGVKYDNITLQEIDTDSMTFRSSGAAGFVKVTQSGDLNFESNRRILSRPKVETSGGLLSGILLGKKGGQAVAQQIISVDSVLLITRLAPDKKRSPENSNRGYFSVWRRVREDSR